MEETHTHSAEDSRLDTKQSILYHSIYVSSKNKENKAIVVLENSFLWVAVNLEEAQGLLDVMGML